MTPILKSKAFWTAVADAVFSLAVYFIGKYAGVATQDLLTIIGALQPVVLLLIAAFTVDDAVKAWASVKEREINARLKEGVAPTARPDRP